GRGWRRVAGQQQASGGRRTDLNAGLADAETVDRVADGEGLAARGLEGDTEAVHARVAGRKGIGGRAEARLSVAAAQCDGAGVADCDVAERVLGRYRQGVRGPGAGGRRVARDQEAAG